MPNLIDNITFLTPGYVEFAKSVAQLTQRPASCPALKMENPFYGQGTRTTLSVYCAVTASETEFVRRVCFGENCPFASGVRVRLEQITSLAAPPTPAHG